MTAIRAIDVTLVTEGTYPFHHGGVTVWCDQLVRGMPDRRFGVVAISATGRERPALAMPANVVGLASVPLWGTPRRSRRIARPTARAVANAHDWLLYALSDDAADPEAELIGALGRLNELSRSTDVAAALRTEAAVRRVHRHLSDANLGRRAGWDPPLPPTVGDGLQAADLLEHFLRPLWLETAPSQLVHCVSNGLPVLVGLAAKWQHGTPMLLTEHGVYLRERYLATDPATFSFPVRALVLRFLKLLTAVGYRLADRITPGSEYNQRWQLRGGADEALIQPVHNGVDPTDFPPAGAEPEEPVLAWVGRIDPIKDLETLITAFAVVRREVPKARLRMFGPTPQGNEAYRGRCEALIDRLGLGESASFEGRVSDITEAYRAGRIVGLTSVSEGFPYTVIEAMASRRATVSTDVGGVREAVGPAGLIVPPRDPEAFAGACVALLRDDRRRRQLAKSARRRVLERFTLARFLDVYRDIYDAVHRVGDPNSAGTPCADGLCLDTAGGLA